MQIDFRHYLGGAGHRFIGIINSTMKGMEKRGERFELATLLTALRQEANGWDADAANIFDGRFFDQPPGYYAAARNGALLREVADALQLNVDPNSEIFIPKA